MVHAFLPKLSSTFERRLLALCKDPTVKEWNKSAVRYIVKKLKKNMLEELEKALSQESSHTKCVLIPKTLDKRLMVSHRRGLPQVIYCRLWRWPDLQSHHQIHSIKECESSTETVCVNPFHYERKKVETLDKVLVPCSRIPPDLSTSLEDSDPNHTPLIYRDEATTITGATVQSLLSANSPLLMVHTSTEVATPFQFKQNRFALQFADSGVSQFSVATIDHNRPTSSQPDQLTVTLDFTEIPFPDELTWCSVTYHELDTRVGEKYYPGCFCFWVDGYAHPMCSDRFCVGGLSNVNRDPSTEWVRRRIGRGVRFTYVDSEVYIECLSDSSIFVSTPMLGLEEGKDCTDEVTKVPHGASVKVFSTPQFSRLLSNAVPKGFEAVYKLIEYCSLRVSFVKGWGKNYKRQSISKTPCWVEIQLNGPLQWIDKVLRHMQPPSQGCGSMS